ncbi:sel1 repeat family protein [Shewanella sp. SR43-4]|jgi:TPR repeat protein|uniref:SEL1-like repeat protein n=2 Tax=Shewanellaceae TaxID=267890 RepID=A0ABV0FTB6_9GAMM|nr:MULTISPECIES: SEL1-like repeat protein [Shewanella]NCQ45354.1 sel1 repeat family protein [Shewanella frigidimarina]MBB1316200.1 sel1 repeat family protein [Shewanella sp. SR43-4]MBB1390770.1 sel1 repeat family protein [Shewanella sp. SG44-6]MBB1475340.1 sel1 repeat family protein [Shewanella sp. SG41-3]NCO70658.1 sel1 repeat family protein [Shewanella vesiculosa]
MKVSARILMLRICLLLLSVVSINVFAVTEAVDIYSDQQLISLIRSNQYLQRVKADDCQLVQDIEARAEVLQQPMYQFLWGEMLNNGVCVKAHPSRGMALLQTSAEQGSAEAMVKLADYYYRGKLVVKDPNRAVQYVLPAAANGDLTARMTLVRLFGEGYGSPADYELGYHWLYNSIFDDDAQQKKASSLLQMLAAKMPASIVARAQQPQLYTR